MSKALRTIGVIAAGVALVAGAIATANPAFLKLSAATIKTLGVVAKVASVVSVAASVGAQITAPKPVARGSPANVVIDVEPPRPYIVGEVMTGGVLRYDNAYGATLNRVPNPFRWQVRVLSGVGPVHDIQGHYFDFAAVSSFYTGFFSPVQQLGARPESGALTPPYGAAPAWGSSSKLSGCAAVGLNFKFDRDGERFAAGLPIYTALVQGELVYDPRQDSTYPGGSGACRLGNEATYVYSRSPALHAGTYAFGRYQDGKRLFGLGLSADAIDWPAVVDWANDCDANSWTANLILYEGGIGANLREQRVRNLDDLCAAGGGRWFQAGAQLSFDWHRPRVSLATLTDEDILEAGGGTDAVQTVRDRMNGVRPQYVSPGHNWQQITGAEIVGSTYRTEDGGRALTQVYPLNGVTNAGQAGQLAAYAMADSRELGPMDLQATAPWRFYRPGDCITIDSSLMAYQGLAVINQRSLDAETLAVSLSLKSETAGKHDFALGKTATPPPTPTLAQTAEERDLLASAAMRPRGVDAEQGATRNEDTAGNAIQTAATFSGAQFSGGANLTTVGGQPMVAIVGSVGALCLFSDYRPVRGGERIYFEITAHTDVSTPDGMQLAYNWVDAAGTVSAVDLPDMAFTGTEAIGIGATKTKGMWVTMSASAVGARLYARRSTWTSVGTFLVRRPFQGRQQPAADVTGQNTANNTANVAGVSAATLVADAATAKADAASALSTLAIIASDGVLDRSEKPEIRKQRDTIIAEHSTITARADAYGVSRAALNTAYTNLIDYLDTLALSSASDTSITRSTFNGRFSDYFGARQTVVDGIAQWATRNEDGGSNMIRAAATLLDAAYANGANLQSISGQPMAALVGAAFSSVSFGGFVPVRGGDTLNFSYLAHSDVSNGDSIRGGYVWRNAAGTETAVDLSGTAMSGSEAVGIGNSAVKSQSATLPLDAVAVQFYVVRPSWGGSGTFLVRRPFMGRAVTQVASAFSASEVGMFGTSYATLQSVTIAAEHGDVIDLLGNFSARFVSGSNSSINVRFIRGGTTIFETTAWTPQYVCPAFQDVPGAGTHTYEMQVSNAGALVETQHGNRYLRALRARR